jgi:hypothetical protein
MGISKVDLGQQGVEMYREIGMLDDFMVLSTIWLCCEVFCTCILRLWFEASLETL